MTDPAQPPAAPPGAPVPTPSGRLDADRMLVLAGIAVVAVLLAGMAMLVVLRSSRQADATASPTIAAAAATAGSTPRLPSRSPAVFATPAPATPAATGSIEEQIAAVEAEVVPIRQLDPTAPVPNRIIDTAELADLVRADFDASNPPATLHAAEALLERLRLLPAGTDLRALELEARSSQVLGFYDFRTKQMTIVRRSGGFGPLEKVTLAHEYTHALQDQHFGIDRLGLSTPDQGDRVLARTALVEGDATLSMTQWMLGNLTPAELGQVGSESSDPAAQAVLDRMPPLLRRELLFPYLEGAILVSRLFASGGWQAVDDAYARPPDSTEQVLHPDKYLAHEQPIAVTLPPATGLGSGWRLSASDTAGELVTQVWLGTAMSPDAAAAAAAGWGGDRIGSYDGPGGRWAIAWLTAWDDPGAAVRFEPAAQIVAGTFAHARVIEHVLSSSVAILVASDGATLDDLAATVVRP
jgi:hypothetical protein